MPLMISNILLPVDAAEEEAVAAALVRCGLSVVNDPLVLRAALHKKAVDARRGKPRFCCTVRVDLTDAAAEARVAASHGSNGLVFREERPYRPVPSGKRKGPRPVVVGFGPAGMFCALLLAKNGYRPIVLERGGDLDARDRACLSFASGGVLDALSNVQFGEGGAGAYSDGKLTTCIGDDRCAFVLSELVRHGAPADILTLAKPHVGTDLLKPVVRSIRREILSLGGEVRFFCRFLSPVEKNGRLAGVLTDQGSIETDYAVLAAGHSARDTFEALAKSGVALEQKPFSFGVRAEHRQADLDRALYGALAGHPALGPAEYKLVYKSGADAVYSFCMCPGGEVVAAASEAGGVVTNGMSYHSRAGKNANAAIVAAVGPDRFPSSDPLAGVDLQRELERRAFLAAGSDYSAPAESLGSFLSDKKSPALGSILPTYPRGVKPVSLSELFPAHTTALLKQAFRYFDTKIKGFASPDALLTAPETRTSSPVRIPRGEGLDSVSLAGLLPCGEGAGYAGGIMSAAVDGLRAAERVMEELLPA